MFSSVMRILICLCALAVLTTGAMASTVPPETMERIKAAGSAEDYPNANALLIYDKTETRFEEDGTAVSRHYSLAKILTEGGIDRYAEDHVPYYKAYDTVMIHIARVIKEDGTVIEVPESQIKDISSAMGQSMNIYDEDAMEKVIAFKNLQAGDCVEVYYTDSLYNAPMDGHYDGAFVVRYPEPIVKMEHIVNGPASKPLEHFVKNGEVDFEKKKDGDRIVYRWWAESVPELISEPAMPSYVEIAPFVLYTTIDSWEEVSEWWHEMTDTKMDMSDELRAEVAALTAGLTTREEKIDSIYHFVAQKVRYMGLGTGKKKGLEPKPATETYETKYGVCRDVATLMVAMLREAEIESEIVLTSMGTRVYDDLPYIGFNHAIVAVKNDDGSYSYIDPTVENNRDWLPAMEAEQQILRCRESGAPLEETPYASPEDNLGHIKAESRLDESGLYSSDVAITCDGFYDMALRQFVRMLPPAQQSIVFGYILQQVYPGAVLKSFDTSDAEDLTEPLELRISYQIQDYPLKAGEFTLMQNPIALGTLELISRSVLQSTSLPEREYPWNLGFTFGAIEEETITLPRGYKIKSVPDAVDKDYGPVAYRMSYTTDIPSDIASSGGQISFRKEFLIKQKQMSPEEYQALKEILKDREKLARGQIIMVKEEG